MKILSTLLMAMIPVVELRGALPYGIAIGLPPLVATITAIVGNMLPVPFIIIFIRRVFDYLRHRKWWSARVSFLENRAHTKGELLQKYRLPGLILLVAIPLPGTGAWTGALVAGILNIRLRESVPAIFAGVCIAAGIILALTMGIIHFA